MNIVELLRSLTDAQVDYVLIGGLAVQSHGYQRATFDVDLVLAMNDANLVRFIEIAQQGSTRYHCTYENQVWGRPQCLANQSINRIPHEVMLARLEQADQMREFFVQMWLQNPALASNAGERIRALLEPMNAVPPAPTFHD